LSQSVPVSHRPPAKIITIKPNVKSIPFLTVLFLLNKSINVKIKQIKKTII
jgi:hypothetical protein